jgi:hypothetical protein
MRGVGQIVRIGEMRNVYRILVGKFEGRDYYAEDLGIDGRIVLEWILWKLGGKVCTEFMWLGMGTGGGFL